MPNRSPLGPGVRTNKMKRLAEPNAGANHSDDLIRLKRIRGQIEGVERMIQESRYCMDVVTQIRSISAALKSVESLVMERHIRHCVSDALISSEPRKTEEKINELIALFRKR